MGLKAVGSARKVSWTLAAAAIAVVFMAAPAQAAFPGRNGRIAFAAPVGDHPPLGYIRTMSPQGTDVQTLAVDTALDDSGPAWAPDGRRLAFVADSTHSYQDGIDAEIYASNPDGGALRRLTMTSALETTPAWSPDGRKLVFAVVNSPASDVPVSEVWTMNSDGTGRRRLSAVGARDYNPSWSPDGTRIAFSSDRSGGREIYTMNTGGTDLRRLTVDADRDDEPSWSPDGRRIVWTSDLETFTGAELYSANASNGQGWVRLTRDAFADREPTFSPDGRWIAFRTQCRSGSCEDHEIWRIRSDGSDPRFLADGISPDWQRLTP